MKRPIRIERLGSRRRGYRIFASRRRPPPGTDAVWIPELDVRGPFPPDVLRPIALLSLRRAVVLLCDCPGPRCRHLRLARALESCRGARAFLLEPPQGGAYGSA